MNFFIDYLGSKGLTDLNFYMNEAGVFSKLFEKDMKSAIAFWNVAQHTSVELSGLAVKLLQVPACIRHIQTAEFRLQKDLSKDQADKVTALYYTLKLNEKQTSS